jgi:mono/diheme cytochrome c family protein
MFSSVTVAAGAFVVLLNAVVLVPPARGAPTDPRETPPKQPLVEGRQVFEAKGCAHCHAGRAGGAEGRRAPDLGRDASWGDVMQFAGSLWNHTPAMAETMRREGIQRPTVSPVEMGEIIAYLFALKFFDDAGDAARGREVFEQRSCAQCHQIGGRGGTVGPRLDELKDYVSSFFLADALWNHGPQMAAKMAQQQIARPRLEGDDVADLVAYIRGNGRGATEQDLAYVQAGSPHVGKAVFREKGCIECHAIGGTGGTVGPDLGAQRPGAHVTQMAAALWNHGPPMWAKMKERGIAFPTLTNGEMANLLAYLYFVQYMGQGGNAARGRQLFSEKSCSSCHTVRAAAPQGAGDLTRSAAVQSPGHWAAAMWNHVADLDVKGQAPPPARPRFDDDEMRDLVEFLRSPGAGQ